MADDQAPDQVQPRGAEHGPEGQQYPERDIPSLDAGLREMAKWTLLPFSAWDELPNGVYLAETSEEALHRNRHAMWRIFCMSGFYVGHDLEDRQKETKP